MQAFQIWTEQRVLFAVLRGAWSAETAIDFSVEFKEQALRLIHDDWAHMVYLEDWVLGVPGMEPVIQELVRWCVSHRLRFAAQVYCPNMIKRYQLDRMVAERIGAFERRVFPNPSDAMVWLNSCGYPVAANPFAYLMPATAQS